MSDTALHGVPAAPQGPIQNCFGPAAQVATWPFLRRHHYDIHKEIQRPRNTHPLNSHRQNTRTHTLIHHKYVTRVHSHNIKHRMCL